MKHDQLLTEVLWQFIFCHFPCNELRSISNYSKKIHIFLMKYIISYIINSADEKACYRGVYSTGNLRVFIVKTLGEFRNYGG